MKVLKIKEEKLIFEQTPKGKEIIKIIKEIEAFKRKYPKGYSEDLELVGIYDSKSFERILKQASV